ncbi:reverse transcriptase domain-containing protein [Tanacetum coccineum]
MQTRSSSKFVNQSSLNPSTSTSTSTNTKRRNRRRSKQRVKPFALDLIPVVTMAEQRTMAELLRAPTEGYAEAIVLPPIPAEHFELKHSIINLVTSKQFFGFEKEDPGLRDLAKVALHGYNTKGYAEAIVVPPIPAEHFELKHSVINLVTSKQFFGFEKEDPHAHIRYFNKITSTLKYKDVPETSIKLMLFPFSIDGPARIWLDKEPPRSILTWDDLVSKFINHFFPTSKTTNLRNEISNFQQRFEETFYEAWDRFKDLLRACPHHGFTELHPLDTFYNGLNPSDQDSLNSAAGGNLLERSTQDVLRIIENKSKCPATDGNTFSGYHDNIQGYVSAAAANYNQGNAGYHPSNISNQIRPTGFAQPNVQNNQNRKNKKLNEVNLKAMQTQIDNVKNELRNEMKSSIQASMSNQTNELKNMMASFFQMNTASTSGTESLPSNTVVNPKGELKAITTRSGLVLDGPSIPIPHPFVNPEEDEREEETFADQDNVEFTIKVPSPPV